MKTSYMLKGQLYCPWPLIALIFLLIPTILSAQNEASFRLEDVEEWWDVEEIDPCRVDYICLEFNLQVPTALQSGRIALDLQGIQLADGAGNIVIGQVDGSSLPHQALSWAPQTQVLEVECPSGSQSLQWTIHLKVNGAQSPGHFAWETRVSGGVVIENLDAFKMPPSKLPKWRIHAEEAAIVVIRDESPADPWNCALFDLQGKQLLRRPHIQGNSISIPKGIGAQGWYVLLIWDDQQHFRTKIFRN